MADKPVCSIPDCGKPACNVRGWCNKHYIRWRRHGDPTYTFHYEGAACSIEGCANPARKKGLCNMHWLRWKRHGDPNVGASREGEPHDYLANVALPYEGDDCLIWPFATNSAGYPTIWRDGRKQVTTNLICHMVFGDPPEPTCQAAHSCGNGHLGCVNPRHLRWATRVENMADKLIHGTHTRGERNGLSKLTERDIHEIRRLSGSMTHRGIARMFGVSQCHVTDIINRRKWAWLETPK